MRKSGWKIIPVLFFSVLSIFLWRGLSLNPLDLPSAQLDKMLPEFTLPQLQQLTTSFSSKNIRNQVVLLNVWASWCAACAEEQVFLLQLAREGVPIYGLNYKDQAKDALDWLVQWGNPYQVVMYDKEGKAAIDMGVYGAPETFVIDKEGLIRYRHAGIMNQELWQKKIEPLMKQLEHSS